MSLKPSESSPTKLRRALSRGGPHVFYGLVLILTGLGVYECVAQRREGEYVRLVAGGATKDVQAADELAVVVALRDHVRRNVKHKGYRRRGRPFLRATAAETLRSGRGHCGEATRAFINMADAAGVRAQRLYLEGRMPHVVAEVRLKGGDRLIVDSYDEPYIPEITTLEQVMRRPEFSSYSSLNWRRALASLPSFKLDLGPLAFYLENPHAIKALFYFLLAAACVGLKLWGARALNYLKRRRAAARVGGEAAIAREAEG